MMMAEVPGSGIADLTVLPELTEKQEAVLVYVKDFYLDHRHFPTLREMAGNFEVSPNAIAQQIHALDRKGYVKRIPGGKRNLRLTQLGIEKLSMIGQTVGAQMSLLDGLGE